MNTYNDNQLTAVKKILSTNDAEQAKRQSAQTVAEFNQYFALGSQLLLEDRLKTINEDYDKTMDIHQQGVANSNYANNLLISSKTADQNVSAMVANTAVVAQSVQVAANAVLKLAAKIGSAYNIVSASEYNDTDIYNATKQTNAVIRETAYQAELASQLAMECTATASQIISKQVLNEANATKALFDTMLKKTSAQLDNLSQARINYTERLVSASTTLHQSVGALDAAKQSFKATRLAYSTSNYDLNLDLTIESATENKIQMHFKEFEIKNTDKYQHKYYLVLAKADAKDAVSYDVAEMRFHEDDKNERFIEVSANQLLSVTLILPKDASFKPKDIDGDEIKTGVAYVAFIYQKMDKNYQKAIGNFSDRITAPSQEFVFATQLSKVQNSAVQVDDSDEQNIALNFQPEKNISTTQALEYRCILVPRTSPSKKTTKNSTSDWFNLDVAKQVARVNYSVATSANGGYSFKLDNLTPDNFGNLLAHGKQYLPVILAIVPENQTAYLATLSELDAVTVSLKNGKIKVKVAEQPAPEPAPVSIVERIEDLPAEQTASETDVETEAETESEAIEASDSLEADAPATEEATPALEETAEPEAEPATKPKGAKQR